MLKDNLNMLISRQEATSMYLYLLFATYLMTTAGNWRLPARRRDPARTPAPQWNFDPRIRNSLQDGSTLSRVVSRSRSRSTAMRAHAKFSFVKIIHSDICSVLPYFTYLRGVHVETKTIFGLIRGETLGTGWTFLRRVEHVVPWLHGNRRLSKWNHVVRYMYTSIIRLC